MNKCIFKLNDICDISGGYAFKSTIFKDNGIPIIRIGDISDNKINISETTVYINENIEKYKNFIISKGDILIALSGATTGKFGIYNYDEPSLLNQRVAKLFPKKDVLNKYLYHYMNKLQDTIYNKALGCAQPNISPKEIGELEIYLPNINEQKAIVEVLDKAQELIDKRKKQIEALDELVKSKFIEMFGDPITNPINWEKKKLAEECNIITGNTPPRKVGEYYGDYIEWIKSDNITDDGIYLTKAREYLSEEGLKVGRSVEENSILMTCIAGSIKCIGNVAIANRKVTFNQQINGIEPLKNNVYFMFEQFNLSQKYIQSTINMSLKGILSKGQLSELEFIFPPIEKQNEFAEFFKQVDKLKFEMEKSLKELEDNFNSLMQKSFKGELFK